MRIMLTFILITCCLSGCSSVPLAANVIHQNGVIECLPLDTLLGQLQSQGVSTDRVGETVRFTLATDRIFYPNTANIRPETRVLFDALRCVIGGYQKTMITVAGFTDAGNAAATQALSRGQAQQVAYELIHRGIDTRLVYTVGYGCLQPIASNNTASGRLQNRRIEVSFQYLPRI